MPLVLKSDLQQLPYIKALTLFYQLHIHGGWIETYLYVTVPISACALAFTYGLLPLHSAPGDEQVGPTPTCRVSEQERKCAAPLDLQQKCTCVHAVASFPHRMFLFLFFLTE